MSSQSRHKRMVEASVPQATVWKAYLPRASKIPSAYWHLSAEEAVWGKAEPFAYYRPKGGSKREPNPGPHAEFLTLKGLSASNNRSFDKAADLFATRHGLLGLFNYFYSAPVPPPGKSLISPEAVVENGRLRLVDPAKEGLELLARMRDEHRPPDWDPPPRGRPLVEMLEKFRRDAVAMPEEVSVVPKALHRRREEFTPASGGYVAWRQARSGYDALLVLDPANVRGTGVSVLIRRESIVTWEFMMNSFPTPPYADEDRLTLCRYLADHLRSVFPAPGIDDNGNPVPGWRCNTLLESMYLMLYLDVMGNAELRQCALRDCWQYYRPGSHEKTTVYCSEKHESLATTRRSRGQEP
jgi:hypothetical protein